MSASELKTRETGEEMLTVFLMVSVATMAELSEEVKEGSAVEVNEMETDHSEIF